MNLWIFTIFFPIIFLFIVLDLVRRGRLTFKYAAGWILLSLIALVFVIFNDWLFALAHWFGFELPSNFVFFALITFFVFLSLLLTTFICQQEQHNTTMAQRLGILEMEIEELRKNKNYNRN